ncbi:MAG: chemotaxis protein CheA, partial [Planctomycetota bacterium]|nr:chemotaxis protein CheA [Planctomycetota bacterium]
LIESYENLDQLGCDLMALEKSPDDRDRLSSIFRTIHTIKGASGFLAFPTLENVTHVGEGLLVRLRDGEMRMNADITNNLLSLVDAVRSILSNIETVGSEGDQAYESLVTALEDLRNGKVAEATTSTETAKPKKTRRTKKTISPVPVEVTVHKPNEAPSIASPVVQTPLELAAIKPPDSSGGSSDVQDSSVRIDVQILDKLMNLVGELVLARNQIQQFSQNNTDPGLTAASQRLSQITTELQEGVMKTRMQPIRNAWSKLPRIVRDLSNSSGKQVQVVMEGAETELDKTILEALRDPLTHIVRNSVDHGIESPDRRLAVGKPPEGTLSMRAFHESGKVIIEVSDDGDGIHVDRVRRKAVEKKLVTAAQAAAMSDCESIQLILLQGFSTSENVTNISGRGVGMDVIKTNIDRIGGTLDIHSIPGQGTTLRIRIPLTLAIIPALVVMCDGDRYCIPQVSLSELVRLDGDRPRKDIELMHSVPVYRLRGQLLPLIYLDEELGLRTRRTDEERRADSAVCIVVLQADDRQFGLVVDEINDTQEIVVKPLGRHIRSVNAFAGSTIMGDGVVSLILDIMGIARNAHVVGEHSGRAFLESNAGRTDHVQDGPSWLIVDPHDGTRAAIPLSTVCRLEKIRTTAIEQSGRQQVVQYRGGIMPLISISELDRVEPDDSGSVSLVVYNDGVRNVGFVVGQIIDIVQEPGASDGKSCGTEADASRIIAGRITRIVNLERLAGIA